MSKINWAAMAVIAITLAAAPLHADAAKGLTRKQVKQTRSIVRQEIAKAVTGDPGTPGLLGPSGPAGPAGPPGPPGDSSGGFEVRFAHIFANGTVDVAHSRGITQENVVFEAALDPERGEDQLHRFFRIVGLPPPIGGQVSGDIDADDFDPNDEHLELTDDGAWVLVDEPPDSIRKTGFHVLLIY